MLYFITKIIMIGYIPYISFIIICCCSHSMHVLIDNSKFNFEIGPGTHYRIEHFIPCLFYMFLLK